MLAAVLGCSVYSLYAAPIQVIAQEFFQNEKHITIDDELKFEEKQLLKTISEDELETMGWQPGTSLKPYASSLLREQMMWTAFDDYYEQRKFKFESMECEIQDAILLDGVADSYDLDLNSSSCAIQAAEKFNYTLGTGSAYVIQVDVLGAVGQSEQTEALIKIKSHSSQQPMIDRSINVKQGLEFDRQLLVVSNQCLNDQICFSELNISSTQVQSLLDVKMLGVYLPQKTERDKLLISSVNARATNFANGDFNGGGTGWVWRKGFSSGICLGAKKQDPNENITASVVNQNINPYAKLGGFTGGTNPNEITGRFSIHQTLLVPENSNLSFDRSITAGRSSAGNKQTKMSVTYIDMTTGLFGELHTENTFNDLSFRNYLYSLEPLYNHSVKFRFEVCSSASSGAFLERYGSIGIDNVKIETFTPVQPSGTLTSNSPCTIAAGSSSCTTRLTIQTNNVPVNCLWLKEPYISLISCGGDANRVHDWPHTSAAGQVIELRSHANYPQSTSDYHNSVFLDHVDVIGQVAQPEPDNYDDVNGRGFTDDLPGDGEPIFAGAGNQLHNFHDSGDQDWVIFAMQLGGGVDIITTPLQGATPHIRAYRINLDEIIETSPGRRNFTASDLLPIGADTSSGNNKITIQNRHFDLGFYAVKITSSGVYGNNTNYHIRAQVNDPNPIPDYYDTVSSRGYTDDLPGDAEPLFAGRRAQRHSFHDAGDQDWTVFLMAPSGSLTVEYKKLGRADVKYTVYEITGEFSEISPGRWDTTLSDLTEIDSGRSNTKSKVIITNNSSTENRAIIIKSESAGVTGFNTDYTIEAYGNN